MLNCGMYQYSHNGKDKYTKGRNKKDGIKK
jgi:hypothetical protein